LSTYILYTIKMTTRDYWLKIATKIVRTEMTKRGVTYVELAEKLKTIGIDINVGNLRRRITAGNFSAMLMLQCLRALNVKEFRFDEAIFEQSSE